MAPPQRNILFVLGFVASFFVAGYVVAQAPVVQVGPAHTRQVTSGQVIAYQHVLTNTGTVTDNFSLEVESTQGWPVELLGGGYPTGTALLPLHVSPQMTTSFQVSLSIPTDAVGTTEVTIVTATSQTSPTVFATTTDTSVVVIRVYLPLVFRRWPPIPYKPSIHAILSTDDGEYSVTWAELPVRLSDTYTLQEATEPSFTTNLRTVCVTNVQSCVVSGRQAGTYYYRVCGRNGWGDGKWSDTQTAIVLLPTTPTLYGIDNSDRDNNYDVTWTATERATSYTLQEANDSEFTSAVTVYNGVETSWSATDRTPRTRYYRVRANGPTGQSDWSAPRSGVIYPLFVGLELRWDGEGYIRLEWYSFDVGTHLERECSNLTDADTIRCHSYHWYNPNPEDWESDSWDSYYSVSTGHFRSSSSPSDPAWKWGYPWILPYDWQLRNGEVFWIDGQIFRASGPYSGYTAFGQAVQYWQLVNRDKFLFHHEDGSDWKQYVHSGDITLWYDAGPTRVLLHGDILRRFYYKGKKTGETVRYIDNLTLSNAFSGGMLAVTRSEDLEVNEDYQLIERELAHGKPCWPVPLRNWKHADIFQIPDHAAAIE